MDRDIDYAAIAVGNALVEKFGRQADLSQLEVRAGDRTIFLTDGQRQIDGTRDHLLATIRAAQKYGEIWQSG